MRENKSREECRRYVHRHDSLSSCLSVSLVSVSVYAFVLLLWFPCNCQLIRSLVISSLSLSVGHQCGVTFLRSLLQLDIVFIQSRVHSTSLRLCLSVCLAVRLCAFVCPSSPINALIHALRSMSSGDSAAVFFPSLQAFPVIISGEPRVPYFAHYDPRDQHT